jgi:hypothetical protein
MDQMTDDNYVLLAAKAYHKPGAVLSEFEEDISRVLYVKRLLTKYYSTGVLKDRLILNHIVILCNSFGKEAIRMLFCRLDERDLEVVKPFLMFIHVLPEVVYGVNGKDIDVTKIRLNGDAVQCMLKLRQS